MCVLTLWPYLFHWVCFLILWLHIIETEWGHQFVTLSWFKCVVWIIATVDFHWVFSFCTGSSYPPVTGNFPYFGLWFSWIYAPTAHHRVSTPASAARCSRFSHLPHFSRSQLKSHPFSKRPYDHCTHLTSAEWQSGQLGNRDGFLHFPFRSIFSWFYYDWVGILLIFSPLATTITLHNFSLTHFLKFSCAQPNPTAADYFYWWWHAFKGVSFSILNLLISSRAHLYHNYHCYWLIPTNDCLHSGVVFYRCQVWYRSTAIINTIAGSIRVCSTHSDAVRPAIGFCLQSVHSTFVGVRKSSSYDLTFLIHSKKWNYYKQNGS